jgi:hypothetical protein
MTSGVGTVGLFFVAALSIPEAKGDDQGEDGNGKPEIIQCND